MEQSEILNTEYLDAMNPELRTTLIAMFLDRSTDEISDLTKHKVTLSNLKEIKFCIHKLKGSTLIIGALAMHKLLIDIEKGIDENNLKSVNILSNKIPIALGEFRQAVQGKYID